MKRAMAFALSVLGLYPVFAARATEALPFKLNSRPIQTEIQKFRGEGRERLAYEILLDNFHAKPLKFTSLQIRLMKEGREVFSEEVRGPVLNERFSAVQESYHKPQDPVLPPGGAGVFFLWVDLPEKLGKVDAVRTGFRVEEQGRPDTAMTLEGPAVSVSSQAPREIAPPLRGERWWTPNGPGNGSIHRRILIPLSGQLYAPERYAVDWIKLGEDGKNYAGDPKSNASYHAYGQEILSVAAGRVVAVKDGIPENVPNAMEMAVDIDLETIGGNHVIVDIGGGLYAFYAHLQPGKIRVKPGDSVAAGQILGLLGNSGNSTEPHLHFHLIDRPDPLRGQGQPFVLSRFTRWRGGVKLDAAENPIGIAAKGKEVVQGQSYMNLELVDFE